MSQDLAHTLLQQGIAAAKAGNKEVARRILGEVVRLDPANELGWLWLAGVAESYEKSVTYLQQVLKINPANERVQAKLKWLQARITSSPPAWQCPLCQAEASEQVARCPKCRAILTLANIKPLLSNTDVDRPQMRQAIDRYRDISTDKINFETHYNLGLAYLNLNKIDSGLTHLQAAIRLQPANKALAAQINTLMQRQADIKAVSAGQNGNAPQHNIMIVDDSPTVRRLVSVTLKRQNYNVTAAVDGMEALAKLSEELPDLIFLDITMPRMDGYQLCKIIKKNSETKHIPVIMLSGNDGFFDKVRGRMAGSTEYVTKPFKPKMLLEIVKKHIR